MKAVKLADLKVGDRVNDIKNPDSPFCTTLEVIKIEDSRIFFKEIAGFDKGYIKEDGTVKFGVYSESVFYLLEK